MSAQYFRLGIVQRNKGFEVKHNFVSAIAVVMLFDFIGQNIKLFYYFILEQTGKISCEFSSKFGAVFFARRQFNVYKINNS